MINKAQANKTTERRELMLKAAKITKGPEDHYEVLATIIDMHRRDPEIGPIFSNVADRAIAVNTSAISKQRVNAKLPVPDDDVKSKELSRLYIRLDLALALANIRVAENTITKIVQFFDKVKADAVEAMKRNRLPKSPKEV
jgi:hypothetical protein